MDAEKPLQFIFLLPGWSSMCWLLSLPALQSLPQLPWEVYFGLCGRQLFFTRLCAGEYLSFRKKKKRKIHHLGTKTQPFCITSNPEAHTADKPEWMQKGSWKRKSMSRIDIFVALDIWKSLGNSQTLNFPASSQLYLLSKIPHVV